MMDNYTKKINYIDRSDKQLMSKLTDIFLKDQETVVALDDERFITYQSFLNYILDGTNLDISIDELAMYKKTMKLNNVQSEWKDTSIDSNRWKCLYANNDKVISYIRSLNPTKVFIMGNLSQELYNYINVYGNNFSTTILETSYENYLKTLTEPCSLLIDTNNNSKKLKNEIERRIRFESSDISKKISIDELCNESEFYYFVNSFLKNKSYETIVFEFPDKTQISNLSFSERLRMEAKINYVYYLSNYKNDPEVKKLIKSVMGELFTDDYLEKKNLSPGTILKNGVCRLADSNNDFCKSINGIRYTTDKNDDYTFDINLFGPCMVYGALVDDKHTIASYLQRKINRELKDYSVNNYGLRAMELPEQIRIADSVNIKEGDKMVFTISSSEKQKLIDLGYDDIISLLPVLENPSLHNYFIDKPAHCNHIANSYIADYMYSKLKTNLLTKNQNNKELAKPVKRKLKRNVFENNKYLDEYLSMLKGLDISNGPNGVILMNCNPFTFGHYNLVDFASKQVNQLFVIVVQDDKSIFNFEDRFRMVQDGCQDFSNVVVIPSGKIFGSSMIFPEYFNRDEKTDVAIDVSLDREIFTDYIAPTLNVKKRFIGEEKTDVITASYNRELKNNLPLYGIEVIEIPRFKSNDGNPISAKKVRKAIDTNDWETISQLVPPTTLQMLEKYIANTNPKVMKKK